MFHLQNNKTHRILEGDRYKNHITSLLHCMPVPVARVLNVQFSTNRYGNYGLPRMADHVLDALLSALPNAGEDPTEHKRLM
ncbi:hypothetical protein SAMN05216387_11532 [Nitrosovibrio tenuis]|uniref:Uncharacterized protein n=1 Tax=Nitrosovibrio tenuis TaxID=1233 RepID=A0A1H7R6R8_9PROT|nr:hypothetical protein SAMN05216387_11532 [Nitrosovibrio tenuis]